MRADVARRRPPSGSFTGGDDGRPPDSAPTRRPRLESRSPRTLGARGVDVRARPRLGARRVRSRRRVASVRARRASRAPRRVALGSVAELEQWGAEEAEFRLADGDDAVVSFGTTWCGPCAILAPELLALANALDEDCDRVDVAKVDAEEADKLATAFGIEAYPTTLWLRDGREVHRLEGSVPAAALVQLTARHLLTAEEEEVMRANQPTWFVGPADA